MFNKQGLQTLSCVCVGGGGGGQVSKNKLILYQRTVETESNSFYEKKKFPGIFILNFPDIKGFDHASFTETIQIYLLYQVKANS